MHQYEAVIQAMREQGGYATLGHLYQAALKVPNVGWGTKTPFASIRRIVQDRPEFFKIRPGLWSLEEYRDQLPFNNLTGKRALESSPPEFDHSYYHGLLVEIGNLRQHETYVPNQDKNKKFLDRPLHQLTTISSIYQFTYSSLVQRAQTIDVLWFNIRKLPQAFIEVEHTTPMDASLLKFVDLQDFHASFYIVAPSERQEEFAFKISSRSAFEPIKKRVTFWSYDQVSRTHSSLYELTLNWKI